MPIDPVTGAATPDAPPAGAPAGANNPLLANYAQRAAAAPSGGLPGTVGSTLAGRPSAPPPPPGGPAGAGYDPAAMRARQQQALMMKQQMANRGAPPMAGAPMQRPGAPAAAMPGFKAPPQMKPPAGGGVFGMSKAPGAGMTKAPYMRGQMQPLAGGAASRGTR